MIVSSDTLDMSLFPVTLEELTETYISDSVDPVPPSPSCLSSYQTVT